MTELALSENALEMLVYGAVFVTTLTPAALIAFLIKDWKEGKLW